MTVRCEVQMCPYREDGWCTNRIVAIGPQGGCLTVYNRRGEPKTIEMNVSPQYKERIKIIEGVEGHDYKKYEPTDCGCARENCGSPRSTDGNDETKE